mgnify:CR=1 FL=1
MSDEGLVAKCGCNFSLVKLVGTKSVVHNRINPRPSIYHDDGFDHYQILKCEKCGGYEILVASKDVDFGK